MTGAQFRTGRLHAGLTQAEAASRLGLSQPYLSQLERDERPFTEPLARVACRLFRLPVTALPVPQASFPAADADPDRLARQLAGLGYPGFGHLRPIETNPAAVVLETLVQKDLEVRLMEALPWVLLKYPELDWDWLITQAKLHDVQNRLGFLTGLAREIAGTRVQFRSALAALSAAEQQLEPSRLVREDTLCRNSMPVAERRWLGANRSGLARHWNLLTGMTAEQLSYAA
ncbi:MAG TPA: helix-turn-helix transcriptional regulator [Steroidobacteraceae bacterium]|nr:helix-turn-helix transcriptional regulator [Steroidobacteraceae bacterium]